MFEPFREGIENLKEAALAWVEMDSNRGQRHERIIRRIMAASEVAADVEHDYITQTVSIDTTGTDGKVSFSQVRAGYVWFYRHIAAKGISGNPSGEIWLDDQFYIGSFDANTLVVPIFSPLAVTEGRKLTVRIKDGGLASSTQIFAQLQVVRPASRRLSKLKLDEAKGQSEGRPSVNQINFGQPEIPNERGTRKDAKPATASPAVGIPALPSGLNGAPDGR